MKPDKSQLAKINRFTKRELAEDEVEVYENLMIDTLPVDSHGIIISDSLIKKFEDDVNEGVPQMLVHDTDLLPVGKVFEGRLVDENIDGESTKTLYGAFYLPKGMKVAGFTNLRTDDLIDMVETGTLSDTSIGFSASDFTCNICGNDIRSWWNCSHIPLRDYIVEDDEGNKEIKKCYAIAEGEGGLRENSLVYSGACDRASVLSKDGANSLNETEEAYLVKDIKKAPLDAVLSFRYSKYGMEVYSNKPILEHKKEDGEEMSKTPQSEDLAIKYEELKDEKESLDTELKNKEAELSKKEDELKEKEAQLAEKENEVKKLKETLEPLEETVNSYRKEVEDSCVKYSIKQFGNAFNEDRYRRYLNSLSLEEVKETLGDLKESAENSAPVGKTTTTPNLSEEEVEERVFDDMTASEKREFLANEAEKLMKKDSKLDFKAAYFKVREKFEGEEE